MSVGLQKKAFEILEKAIAEEKWMSAVWTVKDGKVHLVRTTCEFPHDDFRVAQELLRKQLSEELMPPSNLDPLPTASRFRVMGGEDNEDN